MPKLEAFLAQDRNEPITFPETCRQLVELSVEAEAMERVLLDKAGRAS